MDKYNRCIEQWDAIFSKGKGEVPTTADTGNEGINYGLDWLCKASDSVLDFGCGSGSMLFYCGLRGTKKHLGIDLSSEGIKRANIRKEQMECGNYTFMEGSIEKLEGITSGSIDAVLLSNIIDNLYPEDAENLMQECVRILKTGGKAFIKVNPYLTKDQITDGKLKMIEENLLDDGMLLWNLTDEEWKQFLCGYFDPVEYKKVLFPEYNQYNRLFLMKNSKAI